MPFVWVGTCPIMNFTTLRHLSFMIVVHEASIVSSPVTESFYRPILTQLCYAIASVLETPLAAILHYPLLLTSYLTI